MHIISVFEEIIFLRENEKRILIIIITSKEFYCQKKSF